MRRVACLPPDAIVNARGHILPYVTVPSEELVELHERQRLSLKRSTRSTKDTTSPARSSGAASLWRT